jgi:acetyl-CoA carboxylase biotin carboxyl carrier protein
MIDVSKIKELIGLMKDNDLSEVNITSGEESVALRRGPTTSTVVNHQPVIYAGGAPAGSGAPVSGPASYAPAQPQTFAVPAAAAPAPAAVAAPGAVTIESPMVGTFYSAPNPNAAPFVKIGQSVTPDTVVCIIEAMKVFNEIKAEKAGVVEQMLAKSGQSVEFGQKLFSLRPA